MSDFKDTIVNPGHADVRAPRAPIEETYEEVRTVGKGGGQQDSYSDLAHKDRHLPESARALLAKMEAPDEVTEDPAETDEQAAAAGEVAAELVAEKPVAAAEKPTEKPVEKPAEPKPAAAAATATIDADEHARVLAANKRLLAEVEAERGKTKPVAPAHKLLADIEETYINDPQLALRKLAAAALGVEDPADKKVDDELRALYTDLTATTLGVTPDPAHIATRENARTRWLLERDKRERKAEGQTSAERAKAEAEADKAQKAAEFIGSQLSVKEGEAKSIAEEHPLLMTLAQTFDGMKPEALLYETLKRETATGRLKITGNDQQDLRAAAKLVETHYQALADTVVKARPQPTTSTPSTASPNGSNPSAATPSTSTETRQTTGARTLTNADASAAPAALPAQKPQPKPSERPKFKSKKEAQDYALRHLPK